MDRNQGGAAERSRPIERQQGLPGDWPVEDGDLPLLQRAGHGFCISVACYGGGIAARQTYGVAHYQLALAASRFDIDHYRRRQRFDNVLQGILYQSRRLALAER